MDDKKEAMNYGTEIYDEQKPLWDIHGIDWNKLRYVHEDFFKYLGFELDKETGEITSLTE